ncbi:hypothetical protein EVAR_103892_1 [Eumeta japonica]|uniref:Uncharacterized protein n=1 Tax=Eumeta variegata TaxID=151549 RepID=A0A4C1ZPU9_EUMVA|nr:hypothetical protein EVAR_103892_1 [Eumeta japonica]
MPQRFWGSGASAVFHPHSARVRRVQVHTLASPCACASMRMSGAFVDNSRSPSYGSKPCFDTSPGRAGRGSAEGAAPALGLQALVAVELERPHVLRPARAPLGPLALRRRRRALHRDRCLNALQRKDRAKSSENLFNRVTVLGHEQASGMTSSPFPEHQNPYRRFGILMGVGEQPNRRVRAPFSRLSAARSSAGALRPSSALHNMCACAEIAGTRERLAAPAHGGPTLGSDSSAMLAKSAARLWRPLWCFGKYICKMKNLSKSYHSLYNQPRAVRLYCGLLLINNLLS